MKKETSIEKLLKHQINSMTEQQKTLIPKIKDADPLRASEALRFHMSLSKQIEEAKKELSYAKKVLKGK